MCVALADAAAAAVAKRCRRRRGQRSFQFLLIHFRLFTGRGRPTKRVLLVLLMMLLLLLVHGYERRLLLLLLLLLDGGQRRGQLGRFGPVRRRVAGRSDRRRVAADALQVLGRLDEPAVVGAGCRELGRNERGRRLLLLRSRGARRPTATVGRGVVICRNKTRVVTPSRTVAGGRRRAKPLPGFPSRAAGRVRCSARTPVAHRDRDNWAKARAKSERGRSQTSDFSFN